MKSPSRVSGDGLWDLGAMGSVRHMTLTNRSRPNRSLSGRSLSGRDACLNLLQRSCRCLIAAGRQRPELL